MSKNNPNDRRLGENKPKIKKKETYQTFPLLLE